MFFVFLLFSGMFLLICPLGLIEQPPLQCSQEGLSCSVHISLSLLNSGRLNCSVKDWVKPRYEAPRPKPSNVKLEVNSNTDERNETIPVLSVTINQVSDGSIYSLKGMKVQVHELTTNNSLCICYIFMNNFSWVQRPDFQPWSFVVDQIIVDPGMTYQVSVYNLPKPDVGGNANLQYITVAGCEHRKLQTFRACLENGSLWDPNMTWSVRDDGEDGILIKLVFNTAQFSDLYKVYIHSADFHTELSHKVSKDNLTSISINFSLKTWQLKQCEVTFGIKPFFIRCMEKCSHYQQKVNICSYYTIPSPKRQHVIWIIFCQAVLLLFVFTAVLLHNRFRHIHKDASSTSHNTTDKGILETVPVQERSRVLIIYSQDHPMYTEIVLKLCAFLGAKCGTEVTLDLLDSACLSTIGRIQWLDMQKTRLVSASDKILILCSPGVFAKWNAMCEGRRVMTREEFRSPMGDMLTPALSLIVPEFMHAPSFGKYAVAYFDDVCSEKDVPALFHVAVKYQLMKQFEELFFRLLNTEKYEPGRIKHVHGLGEDDYHSCPSGRDLRDAIKAFQSYQLTNPNWFEMELIDVHEEVEDTVVEKKDRTENHCYCILRNELQIKEISAPVFTNMSKDKTTTLSLCGDSGSSVEKALDY